MPTITNCYAMIFHVTRRFELGLIWKESFSHQHLRKFGSDRKKSHKVINEGCEEKPQVLHNTLNNY